jgi:hypothetical protein
MRVAGNKIISDKDETEDSEENNTRTNFTVQPLPLNSRRVSRTRTGKHVVRTKY